MAIQAGAFFAIEWRAARLRYGSGKDFCKAADGAQAASWTSDKPRMQIPSSTHSDILRIPKGPQAGQEAAAISKGPSVHAERVRSSGRESGRSAGNTPSVSPQQRLENASTRINDRLANLLENEELSDDQKEALKTAGAEFNSLIARMSNAMDEDGFKQKGKMQRAYAFVMKSLRNDVHAALGKTQTDAPADPGAKVDDGADVKPTLASESKAREVTADGMQAPRVPGQADLEHLSEFRSSIDSRLENLASVNSLDKDQLAALGSAHDQFESIMNRVQYGLEHGTLSEGQVSQGYKYALAGLRSDVHSILAGDEEPTGGMTAAASKVAVVGKDADGDRDGDMGKDVQGRPESRLDERLQSAFDSIDSRLMSMINGGNDAASELKTLKQDFGQVFERLQNALDNGFDENRVGQAFHNILDSLKKDVLEAQDHARSEPDPMMYDSKANAYELKGALGSTGIDKMA